LWSFHFCYFVWKISQVHQAFTCSRRSCQIKNELALTPKNNFQIQTQIWNTNTNTHLVFEKFSFCICFQFCLENQSGALGVYLQQKKPPDKKWTCTDAQGFSLKIFYKYKYKDCTNTNTNMKNKYEIITKYYLMTKYNIKTIQKNFFEKSYKYLKIQIDLWIHMWNIWQISNTKYFD